jgi:predicted amidohydrolase
MPCPTRFAEYNPLHDRARSTTVTTLTIALLQVAAHGYDQEANLRTGEAYCRTAAAMGADVVLFPEMWNIGYSFERRGHAEPAGVNGADTDGAARDIWRAPQLWNGAVPQRDRFAEEEALARWRAQAIDRDGPFVAHFRSLARELGIAIALTYIERWPGGPRNSVSLIDRHGALALTYAKVHTCDFDLPEAALTPGEGFPVAELNTAAGSVPLGAMICFDREFPESARLLMLEGAELILVPNACELDPFRIAQVRVRAGENMVGLAMTNYPAPRLNGHSLAFHPMVFGRDGRPRDTLVVEAGEAPGIYLAPFDLDELRAYRQRESWGNAFRRPHLYSRLTEPRVDSPFVRVDAAGERWDTSRRGAH